MDAGETGGADPGPDIHGKSGFRRTQVRGLCALLAVLVFVLFGPAFRFGFVNYDDPSYVYDNALILRGLTPAGIAWAFTHVHSDNWHPLTTILHMLDCRLFGLWPGGHHLVNVLLHAACSLLLFLLLLELTGALWRSGFVAAVFAIHPLRVESVAWVSELKDVLSGLFFMLTLRAYVRYARHPGSRARHALVALWLALGLLSKPMLVTTPFVLLLIDYWPLGRLQHWRQLPALLTEKLPLIALVALSCIATVLAQKHAIQPVGNLPVSIRIGNALVAYAVYLGKLAWPAGLAVLYPLPKEGWRAWEVIASLLLLAALTAWAYRARRGKAYLLVGWLWYLGMLVPVIGIMQVGSQAYADRYTYLPGIGLCIAATWMVADSAMKWRHSRIKLGALSAGILSALLLACCHQLTYWRDSITLWTHTLDCTRDNCFALTNLGSALLERGRTEDAIVQYREAMRISPTYPLTHIALGAALRREGQTAAAIDQYHIALRIKPDDPDAHYNLGNALVEQGRLEEAIGEYRETVRINPAYAESYDHLGAVLLHLGRTGEAIANYRESLQLQPADAGAHYNLANALHQDGQLDQAIAEYREAFRLDPSNADAHTNLGGVWHQLGRTAEAIAEYREAVRINPALPRAHYNLGNVLFEQGRTGEAIGETREALALQPSSGTIQNRLAWLLATAPDTSLRDGPRALELATKASQSAGGADPNILRTLAAAYAEVRDFPNAAKTARTGLQLAEAQTNPQLAGALRREMKLYQSAH